MRTKKEHAHYPADRGQEIQQSSAVQKCNSAEAREKKVGVVKSESKGRNVRYALSELTIMSGCFLGNISFILKIKTPPGIKDFKRKIIKEVNCDNNIRLSR